MNSEEAKFILQAYRHRGEDAQDPQIAEALAQAERDEALGQWLRDDALLHRLMARSLRTIPVPQELKSQILAGGKVAEPAPWWQRTTWLAAAAALVLLGLVATILFRPHLPESYAEFREDMSHFLTTQLTYLDQESPHLASLQQYLSQHDAPADFRLPGDLSQKPPIGCRVLHWRGQTVSLVCFRTGSGQEAHLFILDKGDWLQLPSAAEPLIEPSGFWMTASWQAEDKAFLLAAKGDEDTLRQLL